MRRDRFTRVDPTLDLQTRTVRFIQAAGRNRHEHVMGWLRTGVDVHAREEGALLAASQAGHTTMVDRLIQLGADPWVQNGQALCLGARGGHFDLVTVLLDRMHRSNVRAQTAWPGSGVSPEHARDRWAEVLRRAAGEAVMHAHRPVLDRLVEVGADIARLPEVVDLMAEDAERQMATHQSVMRQGNTVRARMKGSMDLSTYQRHRDLVTWLLHPDRYGPDLDGQLLLHAARAGNMLWVSAVLRLSLDGRIPPGHLDAALLVAETAGYQPVVAALRPRALLAQQDVLRQAVEAALPDRHEVPALGSDVLPLGDHREPAGGTARRRL